LRISDDGKGIASGRLTASTTHGLASMRHRIAGLGGVWEVSSPSAGGTVVTALIPLERMLVAEHA
jgi:signal transduction histidine kinase